MKIITNVILGTAFLLLLGGEAFAQTPVKADEAKTGRESMQIDAKEERAAKAVPGDAIAPSATEEDKKKSKVRTRAISIDEEGVNEEEENTNGNSRSGSAGTARKTERTSTPR